MKIFDYHTWHLGFLPPAAWISTSEFKQQMVALLVFLGASILFLSLSLGAGKFKQQRGQYVQRTAASLYFLGSLFLLGFALPVTVNSTFIILHPVCRLFLAQVLLLIAILGSWFVYQKASELPARFREYVREKFWLTSLLYSFVFVPFVLFDLPLVEPATRTLLAGPLLAVIILHFALVEFMSRWSLKAFGLALPADELPAHLKEKFARASRNITAAGDCTLLIARPGLRNALAFYPSNKIVIGVDLIDHLTAEEIEAVLLHELGHLRDKKHIPFLHRAMGLFFLLYLVYQLASQARLFPSPQLALFIFVGGVWPTAFLIRKARLRAEFVADTFVKEFHADSHGHLLRGLDKMMRLNGQDKDFCKRYNQAHLDLDERATMVEQGAFKVTRRPLKTWLKRTALPSIAMGLVVGLTFSYFTHSDVEKWRALHKQYHALESDGEYQQAAAVIRQALALSEDKFGEKSHRTYISLNDLSEALAALDMFAKAEEYALQAVAVGDALYGGHDLKQVRALENMARIKTGLEQWEEAEQYYDRALALQKQLHADADAIGFSLLNLGYLFSEQNNKTKFEGIVDQFLALYEAQPDGDRGTEWTANLIYLLQDEVLLGAPEVIESFFNRALALAAARNGRNSSEYAYLLSEYGNFLRAHDRETEADKSHTECVTIFRALTSGDREGFADCLAGLADSARSAKEYAQAESYLKTAIQEEEQISGEEYTVYYLRELCKVYLEEGRKAQARQTLGRIIELEKGYYDEQEYDLLLADYRQLLGLMDQETDGAAMEAIRTEVAALEEKLSALPQ